MKRTLASIKEVIAKTSYPGFEFRIEVEDAFASDDPESPGRAWMQVVCPGGVDTVTGAPMAWRGRKWFLSYHMTDTEIVQTVWVAVQRALIHEACELFKFKGQAIFDRHINVNMLAEALELHGADLLDGREPPVDAPPAAKPVADDYYVAGSPQDPHSFGAR